MLVFSLYFLRVGIIFLFIFLSMYNFYMETSIDSPTGQFLVCKGLHFCFFFSASVISLSSAVALSYNETESLLSISDIYIFHIRCIYDVHVFQIKHEGT